jgi:hypothetical protein
LISRATSLKRSAGFVDTLITLEAKSSPYTSNLRHNGCRLVRIRRKRLEGGHG